MGWNSWDCCATTVTEEQVKTQADYMAAHLKDHGWQSIVVDIPRYEPGAKSHAYRADAQLTLDGHGRVLPAPNRLPSAAGCRGFKALADYVHGLGLKFGVHLTLALLTNDEVLAVNQLSGNNRPLFTRDGLVAWVAAVPGTPDKYLAVFNTREAVPVTPENARFVSLPVTADPATAADLDADLRGGHRLILAAQPDNPAGEWNRVLWRNPRLEFADGTVRPLTDFSWACADACWDSTGVRTDAQGRVEDLGAEIPAVVEYDLPPGAVRFLATGAKQSNGRGQFPGPGRFFCVVATPANTAKAPGVPVPVAVSEMGFPNGARIFDLWAGKELESSSGEFASFIPYHGAGLYRPTPLRPAR